MSEPSTKCVTCGCVYDKAVDESCPVCAFKHTMSTRAATTDIHTSAQLVQPNRSVTRSDPLVLAELKRQTAMLKTITGILITFSAITGIGLIYSAIVLSGL